MYSISIMYVRKPLHDLKNDNNIKLGSSSFINNLVKLTYLECTIIDYLRLISSITCESLIQYINYNYINYVFNSKLVTSQLAVI